MSALQDLRRSTADRKLTGLCGGIAQQWRIDPLLVRVLAVLLVLSGGVGLVLYAFGWLTVPEEGSTETTAHRLLPQSKTWSREVWVVILVVVAVVTVGLLGQFVSIGLAPALIVAAVWYFGFRKPNAGSAPAAEVAAPAHDPLAGPSTPFTDAARAWQERMAQYHNVRPDDLSQSVPADFWASGTDPVRPSPSTSLPPATGSAEPIGPAERLTPTSPYAAAPNPQTGPTSDGFYTLPDPAGIYAATAPGAPDQPTTAGVTAGTAGQASSAVAHRGRRRSTSTPAARRLRLLVLVVAGLALAGLGLADVLGASISAVVYLSTTLLIVGLGLVVAGWVGRARGLLPIGILLLIATVLTQAGTSAWSQYGDQMIRQEITYTKVADLPPTDHWDVGTYVIDLSGLTVTADRTYEVNLDVGRVDLTLPADQRVRVEASTDAGVIDLPENYQSGPELVADRTYGPSDEDLPLLTIKIRIDAGRITVTR